MLVLHDWMGDCSTWEPCHPYLDLHAATWLFAELRGYGRSRDIPGEHTLQEGAADALALAEAQGWDRFMVVAHSMSTLIALHLAQRYPERIEAVVLVTPPPPFGFGVDEEGLAGIRALALADDAGRLAMLAGRSEGRLGPAWARFKVRRWREAADPQAVADYSAMFARDGIPDRGTKVGCPALVITGEQDDPPMRAAAAGESLRSVCRSLRVEPIATSGHYPMQETPPRFVALVEGFLAQVEEARGATTR